MIEDIVHDITQCHCLFKDQQKHFFQISMLLSRTCYGFIFLKNWEYSKWSNLSFCLDDREAYGSMQSLPLTTRQNPIICVASVLASAL